MPANRIVALLTPVVALAAGAAATWLAEAIPGLEITPGQMETVFIAGLAAVLAPAAQWLYGAQKHERNEAMLEAKALQADMDAATRASQVDEYDADEPDAYGPEDEYEDEDEGYEDDEDSAEDEEDDEAYEAALAEDDRPVHAGG